jgi:hypothetical protein
MVKKLPVIYTLLSGLLGIQIWRRAVLKFTIPRRNGGVKGVGRLADCEKMAILFNSQGSANKGIETQLIYSINELK